MASHLPFDALRTFLEIARGRSLAEAAARMNITAGAASQRLQALEAHLSCKLVAKKGRRLVPTERGLLLFEQTHEAASAIEAALSPRAAPRVLTLHISAAFYEAWLVPRLPVLSSLISNWSLEVETSPHPFDQKRAWTAYDFAIRYDPAVTPDLVSYPVMTPSLSLVSSAALDHGGSLASALSAQPLLRQQGYDDWPFWLGQAGLSETQVRWGPRFEDDADALRAARGGVGIASTRSCNLVGFAGVREIARREDPLQRSFSLVLRRADLDRGPYPAILRWACDKTESAA